MSKGLVLQHNPCRIGEIIKHHGTHWLCVRKENTYSYFERAGTRADWVRERL